MGRIKDVEYGQYVNNRHANKQLVGPYIKVLPTKLMMWGAEDWPWNKKPLSVSSC